MGTQRGDDVGTQRDRDTTRGQGHNVGTLRDGDTVWGQYGATTWAIVGKLRHGGHNVGTQRNGDTEGRQRETEARGHNMGTQCRDGEGTPRHGATVWGQYGATEGRYGDAEAWGHSMGTIWGTEG